MPDEPTKTYTALALLPLWFMFGPTRPDMTSLLHGDARIRDDESSLGEHAILQTRWIGHENATNSGQLPRE